MLTQRQLLEELADSNGFRSKLWEEIPSITQDEIDKGNYPMSSIEIEAFLEEFPWVSKHVERKQITQAHVTTIEPTLFAYKGLVAHVHSNELLHIPRIHERLYLLDWKGTLVVAEVPKTIMRRRYWLFGQKVPKVTISTITGEVNDGSTIAQTFANLAQDRANAAVNRVGFILSYFAPLGSVIVYKPPKNLSVSEWVQRQIQDERAKLQAATAAIDAQAESN